MLALDFFYRLRYTEKRSVSRYISRSVGKGKQTMNLIEKTRSKHYIFQGHILNLRVDEAELPNGQLAEREVIEHPGGVCIAALTDREELLFVRQFRYPYGKSLLEIPAGKRNPGEDPLTTGMRELSEETGYSAEHFISLGQLYPSPGYLDEVIYLYLAVGLIKGETHPDEDEFLETETIPLNRAVEMVMAGEISDAKTQVAVLKLWYKKQQGEF